MPRLMFERPRRIEWEELGPTFGRLVAEPFEKGYALTVGNSLRRALLAAIPGSAVTWVRVDGLSRPHGRVPGIGGIETASRSCDPSTSVFAWASSPVAFGGAPPFRSSTAPASSALSAAASSAAVWKRSAGERRSARAIAASSAGEKARSSRTDPSEGAARSLRPRIMSSGLPWAGISSGSASSTSVSATRPRTRSADGAVRLWLDSSTCTNVSGETTARTSASGLEPW